MGWMQFRHIKKSQAIFRRFMDSRQISNCGFLFEQSYSREKCIIFDIAGINNSRVLAVGQIFVF